MTVNAIIQARCGSSRFPDKIFADIDGKPLLEHAVSRLLYAQTIDRIVVATTIDERDDKTAEWCVAKQIACFRGSEKDVLNRYYCASLAYPSDVIVRITADDPVKEPSLIDKVVSKLIAESYDLVTNNLPPSFPEGLDCEAFTFQTLETMEKNAENPFEREHVTQYAYRNASKFKIGNITSGRQLSTYRWTIDTQEDYEMIKTIYAKRTKKDGILLMNEILEIMEQNPDIQKINAKVTRSAMYQ